MPASRLLMDKLGIDQVGKIRLAGAFGCHIDVKYAMVLGLIPDCDLSKVQSAGNAAGTGARIALLNMKARDEIESGGAPDREDRNRGRADVPAAFRGSHGNSAQDGGISAAFCCRYAPIAERNRCHRG